jgi:peptide/nickel transport system permease protein
MMVAMVQVPAAVAAAADMDTVAPRSYLAEVRTRFCHNRAGMIAVSALILLAVAAIVAPLLSPYDPLTGNATHRLLPIGSAGHFLGTDEQGRDMLTRLLYGGRLSLLTGMLPVIVATVIGTAIGATAAYLRGLVGAVLMRTMDMLYAFPAIMLAIAISASLGPGVTNSVLAISVVFIAPISRVAEAATRRVIFLEYIDAARLSGASTAHILRSQVLPNIFNPIFVYASGLIGLSIVIASGLSFLGMGARPPVPEWGFMLNSLRGVIYVQPWVAALPGFLIFATSVSCNMLSDALRDALDIRDA